MSPKQKKIAAKAPPPDKIDAKDFAVLKAEKAKGRGMGLQDESIKPGKVMKARYGKAIKTELKADPTKPISSVAPKASDILKKKKLPGRIGTALGIASMMVPAVYAATKQYKDYKSAKNRDEAKVKKMGGGMAKKYSVGGGADMSKVKTKKKNILDKVTDTLNKAGEAYKKLGEAGLNVLRGNTKGQPFPAKKMVGGMAKKYNRGGGADMGDPKKPTAIPKGKDSEVMVHNLRPSDDPNFRAYAAPRRRRNFVGQKSLRDRRYAATPGNLPKPAIGKMGGGMMNKPMGYKSGTMVKARGCKLGRTRPTKMY